MELIIHSTKIRLRDKSSSYQGCLDTTLSKIQDKSMGEELLSERGEKREGGI